MKKLNNKGFGAIEVILIVVIIGLIGGAGYYVYNSQKKTNTALDNAANSQAEPQKSEKNEESKQVETDEADELINYSRFGVSFVYTKEWTIDAQDNTQSQTTYLKSPDFVAAQSTDQQKGEMISIYEQSFKNYGQDALNVDNFKAQHLDSNPNSYSDYKILDINGKKAVQFYRGDSRTTVFFVNEKYVVFVLDTFPDRASTSQVYDSLLNSVNY